MGQENRLYKKGEAVYAKTDAVNAQWQMATIAEDQTEPDKVLVEFGDGSQFRVSPDNIGGIAAAPLASNPQLPTTSSLPLHYEAFLQRLVELESVSMELFALPVEAVLLMMRRQANRAHIVSTGTMDMIDNSPVFTPDLDTLRAWGESYVQEIVRRQNGEQ